VIAPAFLKFNEVAERLGYSQGKVRRDMPKMLQTGFPPRDPVNGLYPAAGVEAWIERRSRIADDPATVTPPKQGVNHHAL
jgi:hypothetical protein